MLILKTCLCVLVICSHKEEAGSLSLLEHQMRELDGYRMAVQKMGQEIVALRNEIRDLQSANTRLQMELSNQNDATKLLIDSSELDGLTKTELASRYSTYHHYFFFNIFLNF